MNPIEPWCRGIEASVGHTECWFFDNEASTYPIEGSRDGTQSRLSRQMEAVAEPGLGEQVLRSRRILLDLFSQLIHKSFDLIAAEAARIGR